MTPSGGSLSVSMERRYWLTGNNIYLYQHNGVEYSLAKQKPRPDDVDLLGPYCNKAVSASGVFVQNLVTSDAVTHKLRLQDLEPADILHHKGKLMGVVHPNTLVYRQERGVHGYTVTLHQRDGTETILKLPPGRKWKHGLSVCRAGESLVVVEHLTQSLDVFTTSGNILLLFLSYESLHMSYVIWVPVFNH